MTTINSLWIGTDLNEFGIITAKSHLTHGHEFNLWVYRNMKSIPDGVAIRDASEIIPRSVCRKWFENLHPQQRFKHTKQTFANYFRYKLIHKYGGWWVNMDGVCVKPFDFTEEYVLTGIDAIPRPELKNYPFNIINGTFKAPKEAPFLQSIIEEIEPMAQEGRHPRKFGMWGTVVFTKHAFKHGLEKYKTEQHVFCPFGFKESERMFKEPNAEIPDWAYTVHLYNYVSKNECVKDSIYDRLRREYL